LEKQRKFLRGGKAFEGFTFSAFTLQRLQVQALRTLTSFNVFARNDVVFAFTSVKALTLKGVEMLLPFEMFALYPLPLGDTHAHSPLALSFHVLALEVLPLYPLSFHPLTLKVLALAFTFHHHSLPLFGHGRWHA
jgi:hypothetical protein